MERKFIQSNVLINARQAYSLYEYRILYYALRQIYMRESQLKNEIRALRSASEDVRLKDSFTPEEKQYMIDTMSRKENRLIFVKVSDFASDWKIDDWKKSGTIYSRIVSVMQSIKLKTSTLKVETTNNDGKKMIELPSFFENAVYVENESYFVLSLTPAIIPYVIGLDSKFTIMFIENVVGLKTSHAIRIYELLLQNKVIGYRDFQIRDFAFLLGLNDAYVARRENLYTRVIKPSIEQINEKTNLTVAFNFVGRGDKTRLHFDIKSKRQKNANKLIEAAAERVGDENAKEFVSFVQDKVAKQEGVINARNYAKAIIDKDDNTLDEFEAIKIEDSKRLIAKHEEEFKEYLKALEIDENRALEERKKKAYELLPSLKNIEDDLNEALRSLPVALLKGEVKYKDSVLTKEELEIKRDKLVTTKEVLLESVGLKPEYLERRYACNKCKDTCIDIETGKACECKEIKWKEYFRL